MSCWRRCLLGLVLLALAAGLLAAAAFVSAAGWLLQADAPTPADAIVVLAGDPRRARHAGDLFRQGYAPRVLLSRPVRDARERMLDDMGIAYPRSEEIDTQVLEKAGVARNRIDYFGHGSLSTFDEALALQRLFAGRSPHLLVVTSPYHVRRARLILAAALPQATLTVVATPYETFPVRWWTSQDAARDLLLELAKLAFYFVGGRFSAAAG